MNSIKTFGVFLFAFISLQTTYAQFDSQNISLYSNWYDSSMAAEPIFGAKYNSCFGWTQNDREYAILGSSAGTFFLDVTIPSTPVLRDFVAGRRDSCVWREYQTYGKYLYMVSDDSGPNSFQIADLSYLPDSVHIIHDGVTIFERSHTVFVDGNKLYCGSVSGSFGNKSMRVYSLADPTNPTLLRSLNDDYSAISSVHDMMVRNDTVYASCGYDGFYIFKFDTISNTFSMLASLTTYNFSGYNHSSAMTEDGKTLVFADEVPTGLPMKTYDVSDFGNLVFKSNFASHSGATPHNPYVVGNKVVIAYYEDGIQVYDISNPSVPTLAGFFDTHPQNGTSYNGYKGAWGSYTELPSGTLLASDMQNGLFVLDASSILGTNKIEQVTNTTKSISIYPNPTSDAFTFRVNGFESGALSLQLFDISGRMLLSTNSFLENSNSTLNLSLSEFESGVYVLKIQSKQGSVQSKILKY